MRFSSLRPGPGRPLPAVLACLLTLTSAESASAQAAELIEDFQSWNRVTLQGCFSRDLRWGFEVEGRLRTGARELGLLFIRPFVTLPSTPLNRGLTVNLGFAHALAWPTQGTTVLTETRLFQDFIYRHSWDRALFTHRLRLEERWIPNVSDVTLRVRYRFQVQYPLNALRLADVGSWSLLASDELLYQLNSPIGTLPGGFEQNRANFSIRYQMTPELNIELGYIGTFFSRPEPRPDLFTHGLLTVFTYDFDPPPQPAIVETRPMATAAPACPREGAATAVTPAQN